MRVVVDSHAVVWCLKGSSQLSPAARNVLTGAGADAGIVVSIAHLIDLWYVTQTTRALGTAELERLRDRLLRAPAVDLHPVDVDVADAYFRIDRGLLRDPWDRLSSPPRWRWRFRSSPGTARSKGPTWSRRCGEAGEAGTAGATRLVSHKLPVNETRTAVPCAAADDLRMTPFHSVGKVTSDSQKSLVIRMASTQSWKFTGGDVARRAARLRVPGGQHHCASSGDTAA